MKYFCITCAYESSNKSNLNKHLKSTKHNLKCITEDENTKSTMQVVPEVVLVPPELPPGGTTTTTSSTMQISLITETLLKNHDITSLIKSYLCNKCGKIINDKSNYYKHKRVCKVKESEIREPDNIKELLLVQKLEYEKRMRELLEKQVEDLKDDKEFSQKITENTNKIADKIAERSMSALNFVIKNMNDAPILKALPNDDIKNMLDYGDKSDTYMIESLVYAYKEHTLIKLLGDAIIKHYKKDNPKLQSLWNTDVSRLTYLIRLTVHDEDDWIVDKQGVRTNKIIIEPFLQYIRDKTLYFVRNFHKLDKLKALSDMDFLKYATSFVNEIDNGTIKDEIVKYIAPYLALERREHKIKC